MTGMSRRFTVVDFPREGDSYGVYRGNTPRQAANKAFSRLSRMIGLKNSNDRSFLVLKIRDMDSGDVYEYIGTRVELVTPVERRIGNKRVVFRYRNVVSEHHEDDF